jgi:N-carbamoylputrescine amidase
MDDLRIAAVCMHAPLGEVEKNLDHMASLISEASEEGASIVCFPELSVTGYTLKRSAEVCGGAAADKIMDRLVGLAREARLVLIAGFIEVSDAKRPYITQVIAGPEGLIGLYRKTHLSPAEKDVYQAGQDIEVYNFGNTTFGVALCYETHFPEISAVLALKGADILFFPHASPRGDPKGKFQSWMRHLPARAFDNGVFVVACNQVGNNKDAFLYPGVALVLGPDGQILTQYTGREERIVFADLKADYLKDVRQHRMKYFIPQRRPVLYKRIVADYPS